MVSKSVVCVFNDFKKTMTSGEANKAVKKYLESIGFKVTMLEASDGGPGFLQTIDGDTVIVETVDNLLKPITAYYKIYEQHAFIESSLIMKEKNIWEASSYGVGLMILDAVKKGAKYIHLGLGGSLTNDGGFGILKALGAKFYLQDGTEAFDPKLKDLKVIDKISLSELLIKQDAISILLVCDVMNPLLGQTGATAVFARQKGAKKSDLFMLELSLAKLHNLLKVRTSKEVTNKKGLGAAGGMGLSLYHLFDTKIVSGSEYFILRNKVFNTCDYIITGEGKYDDQSFLGKLPFVIKENFPNKTIIIAGESQKSGYLIFDLISSYGKKLSFENPEEALVKKVKELYLTGILKND